MTRRTAGLLAAAALATLGVAGCSGSDSGSGDAAPSAVATATGAPAAGATLAAGEFAAALKRPGTTVLDVRTPQEFAAGHLPGAVNLDISSPDFATRLESLDRGAPYAVYCRSGNRSATALATMGAMGFTAAYHLDGGIGAWQDAGGEVVDG